jgi:ribose transport system substrate-binding protein
MVRARRRAWALVSLAAVLGLVALTGCGSSDSGSSSGSATSAGQSTASSSGKTVKTSMVLHLRVPAVEAYGQGAIAAAKQLGFDVNVVGPQQVNNLEQQKIAQAEVDAGSQGLGLLMVGAESWRRPIAKWQKDGVRVVSVGIQTGEFMGADTPLLIAPNDIKTGELLADLTLKALGSNPSGEIVVGTSIPGLKLLEDRIKGFKQVMAEKAPGVKVTVVQATDDNVKGVTDWQAITKAHGNALAFVGLASTAPPILGKIKKDTGSDWVVSGCEIDPRVLPMIKDGTVAGVTSADFWNIGYMAARVLYEQIANDKYTDLHGWLDSGTTVVTPDNIDEIVERESSPEATAAYFEPRIDQKFEDLEKYVGPY